MRKHFFCFLLTAASFFVTKSFAQNVAINEDGSAANPNAILDIKSFTKGILIPRVSTTGRLAIPNTKGLLVYDSTIGSFFFNTGIEWQNMISTTASTAPTLSVGGSWSVSGNSDIDPVNQFIGTTDNKALHFRVSNNVVGELHPVTRNISWGLGAGYNNTTGSDNIAIGTSALENNSTGNYNTANGSYALQYNTTGFYNTASGSSALQYNTTGYYNTANGRFALRLNSTGYYNTAVGGQALAANTTGQFNTAVGNEALFNSGSSSYNTAVGYQASLNHHVGWNNTFIGAYSGVAQDDLFNCVAIGNNAYCFASNQVMLGNSYTTKIGGYAGWSQLSDGRYKKNIKEDVKGLDFIMKLRPVTYQLDITGVSKKLNEGGGKEKDEFSKKAIAEKEKTIFTGFIAQEVEKVAKESGYNFSGVDIPKTDNEFYGLRYSEFVVPLVKAIQEQQKIIEMLQKQVEAGKAEIPMQIGKQQQTIQSLHQTISTQNLIMSQQDKKMADLQKQIDELKQLVQHSK